MTCVSRTYRHDDFVDAFQSKPSAHPTFVWDPAPMQGGTPVPACQTSCLTPNVPALAASEAASGGGTNPSPAIQDGISTSIDPGWHDLHDTPARAEPSELDPGWELAELADFFGVDAFF